MPGARGRCHSLLRRRLPALRTALTSRRFRWVSCRDRSGRANWPSAGQRLTWPRSCQAAWRGGQGAFRLKSRRPESSCIALPVAAVAPVRTWARRERIVQSYAQRFRLAKLRPACDRLAPSAVSRSVEAINWPMTGRAMEPSAISCRWTASKYLAHRAPARWLNARGRLRPQRARLPGSGTGLLGEAGRT